MSEHVKEYLCPNCTPEIITILARYDENTGICPRCKNLIPIDDAIASNYTWLYIEEGIEL